MLTELTVWKQVVVVKHHIGWFKHSHRDNRSGPRGREQPSVGTQGPHNLPATPVSFTLNEPERSVARGSEIGHMEDLLTEIKVCCIQITSFKNCYQL